MPTACPLFPNGYNTAPSLKPPPMMMGDFSEAGFRLVWFESLKHHTQTPQPSFVTWSPAINLWVVGNIHLSYLALFVNCYNYFTISAPPPMMGDATPRGWRLVWFGSKHKQKKMRTDTLQPEFVTLVAIYELLQQQKPLVLWVNPLCKLL